jgi:hypothetical protein
VYIDYWLRASLRQVSSSGEYLQADGLAGFLAFDGLDFDD